MQFTGIHFFQVYVYSPVHASPLKQLLVLASFKWFLKSNYIIDESSQKIKELDFFNFASLLMSMLILSIWLAVWKMCHIILAIFGYIWTVGGWKGYEMLGQFDGSSISIILVSVAILSFYYENKTTSILFCMKIFI